MASAGVRRDPDCSICLDICKDPVMLSCGHYFCQICIENVLDTQEENGLYTCPDCRKQFSNRPAPQRSLKLCNVAEYFLHTQPMQVEKKIVCTYCIHTQVSAVKICLHCEAALCDNHVTVHSKSEEHVLTEPTTVWINRKCSVHQELLKYYCPQDAACICVSCCRFGDHRGHRVELLNKVFEHKKKKLRNVLQTLTSKRKEMKERDQNLQTQKRNIQEKSTGLAERVSALFWDISELLQVLEDEVLREITRQENEALNTISDLIRKLEKEQDELSGKMSHFKELCSVTHPLDVLQEQESHRADLGHSKKRRNKDSIRCDENVPAMSGVDEDLISVMVLKRLDNIVTIIKKKRGLFVQKAANILLDVNTAGKNVAILDYMKTANWSLTHHQRPEKPTCFKEYSQVLSVRGFSSGRHYWEVKTSETGDWRVGMCYPSIKRCGATASIGQNNKSWCLGKYNKDLSVTYNTVQTPLPHQTGCQRLGILLDYEAGRLSFYELCDSIKHLHTFTATFTEPLYAAFWVQKSWVSILK